MVPKGTNPTHDGDPVRHSIPQRASGGPINAFQQTERLEQVEGGSGERRLRSVQKQITVWITKELSNSSDTWKPRSEDTLTRIYGCATMWHETEAEMEEMLKSIFRIDKDHEFRQDHQLELIKSCSSSQRLFTGCPRRRRGCTIMIRITTSGRLTSSSTTP